MTQSPEPSLGHSFPTALDAQRAALADDHDLQRFATSRERLATDPHRPLYHFSPPENIMNDPCGLCQWRGRYHLFYQFRPEGQDRVHWGHTVSDDLVRWTDLPVAIHPATTERDCLSGQTLVEPDRVIASYHGAETGIAIATASDPLLLNWEKHPKNPVIPDVAVDADGSPYIVSAPCIWGEEDGYYVLLGTHKDGQKYVDCRAVHHLFRSADLAAWEQLDPLIEDGFYSEPGEDGGCPNFWPIGDGRHLLLCFSHKRAGQYYVGTYDRAQHRLVSERHGRMNYGPVTTGSLHAPSATIDDQGRFLGVFNVKEGRTPQGWDNIMTLPRHYWLGEDGTLRMAPVREVESLRGEVVHQGPTEIPSNGEVVLNGVRGKALEIDAVLDLGSAREVGLIVLRSPDGSEQTRVSLYRRYSDRRGLDGLQIDVSAASLREDVYAREPEIGPLDLGPDEPLRLRVFVDRSVIEVFAADRQCLTLRAYPDREDSNGVAVFARGGSARLESLDAWQMQSVWPELTHLEGR